jgi:retron-type reverse transcriptase
MCFEETHNRSASTHNRSTSNQLDRNLLKKAFRIIRRNYGCPGNDGLAISEIRRNYGFYEELLVLQLTGVTFKFESAPKKSLISDYLGKPREIFVYCVLERWVQEYLKLLIEPSVEELLAFYTFAFRQKKYDVDSYVYILRRNPKYILRVDIMNFFASINKENVLSQLDRMSIPCFAKVLVRDSLQHHRYGLPLGHVLSCILANLSLYRFDLLFPNDYTRFSDDMMFACDTLEILESTLHSIEKILDSNGFKLNHSKTKVLINPTLEMLT